jgi:1,4-alpha-glucan branching enzyme
LNVTAAADADGPELPAPQPAGFLSLTLHAHLPYVIHHGTWPHGMEWLLEAAAECYLPLLRVFWNLERDGIALHCNLNLSPVLLEQLAHEDFKSEFPRYLERKIVAAREDEAFFLATNQNEYAELARYWESFFSQALGEFRALGGDLIRGFRELQDRGQIEILTCCATHGYLPLLGTDESARAQVQLAVATHTRHFGRPPRGIWVPECGYRPAGWWSYPVRRDDGAAIAPDFDRVGVEQVLAESGLSFFFVDTHLIEDAAQVQSPYAAPSGRRQPRSPGSYRKEDARNLYRPWLVRETQVSVFPRDPHTGLQVWSGETGYPGDFAYLDFHKKRWPGGHRYWRVTGPHTDMAEKTIYNPDAAKARIQSHAEHFLSLVRETLAEATGSQQPPVLSAPFDAELFGHWWFEGPQWLEAVARLVQQQGQALELIGGATYLDRFPHAGSIALPEGSWGAEGGNDVWLNSETRWTYERIYPAELYVREVCTAASWKTSGPVSERIVKQLCRELLLMESSDWQFLITTGAARDYAELRFNTHHDQFGVLKCLWESFESGTPLSEEQESQLAAIEARDNIFHEIDPDDWAIKTTRKDEVAVASQSTQSLAPC